MNRLRKNVLWIYHNFFNLKFAVISAVFNAVLVIAVNHRYGWSTALMSGAAQACSSFFSTGVTARVVQHFSPIKQALPSYVYGSFIPATLTFAMSLAVHRL